MAPIIWIVLGIIVIIAEMMTGTFVLLWIGIAGIIAGLSMYVVDNIWVSFVVFILSAFLLWLSTKSVAKTFYTKPDVRNGVYALIGKEIVVSSVSSEDAKMGTCKVHGDEWNIQGNRPLQEKEKMIVVRVEGATLYVTDTREEII
ncbi:NfeD family protein [Bacillus sp. 165]|uniref:NfeD family protein n=1 Tax=Bacillus sp. 165 TaxID=1529117 RepID=UPI001ADA5A45|nr:NfeD family protein [Bacillus sp. 165]MBO9128097.1 NfeD family protein [Bacillus sp. 165]